MIYSNGIPHPLCPPLQTGHRSNSLVLCLERGSIFLTIHPLGPPPLGKEGEDINIIGLISLAHFPWGMMVQERDCI